MIRTRILLTSLLLTSISILFGCGADQEPGGERSNAGSEPIIVAALGDSIMAGSPLWDPDPGTRQQIGPSLDQRSQFEYWAARANPGVEFRNCGVFGERTDQIALRLDDCAAGTDALIIQGGINDIAQGRPVGEAAGDLRAMVMTGKDLGLPVALVDVLPWNNGHPDADDAIEKFNREIERIGQQENVPVLPFHDALEDPGEPGVMSADLTIDGDHPSIAGYRVLGEQAFELPPTPDP